MVNRESLEVYQSMNMLLIDLNYLETRRDRPISTRLVNGCGTVLQKGPNHILETEVVGGEVEKFTISIRDYEFPAVKDFFNGIVRDGFKPKHIATWTTQGYEIAGEKAKSIDFSDINRKDLENPIKFCSYHEKKLPCKGRPFLADSYEEVASAKIVYIPKSIKGGSLFGIKMGIDKWGIREIRESKHLELAERVPNIKDYIDVLVKPTVVVISPSEVTLRKP